MAKPAQATESAQLASSARDHLTSQPSSPTCVGGPTRSPLLLAQLAQQPSLAQLLPSDPHAHTAYSLRWPSRGSSPAPFGLA